MSGRAVRRAFDAAPERGLARLSAPAVVDVRPVRRQVTVRQAVEWAFGPECASIEFDELSGPAGVDTLWVLAQRAALGCKVDGGGASARAAEAEIIAAVLARLPEGRGGKAMALCVARHARTGSAPRWDVPLVRGVEPVFGWVTNRFGLWGKPRAVPGLAPDGWGAVQAPGGGPVMCVPVRFVSSAQAQAAARREWLAWRGALEWLGWSLASVRFQRLTLVEGLPPLAPWDAASGGGAQDAGLTAG